MLMQWQRVYLIGFINPTPLMSKGGWLGGYAILPYWKVSITPINIDSKEPKFCDFSDVSMGNPPTKIPEKMGFQHFLFFLQFLAQKWPNKA